MQLYAKGLIFRGDSAKDRQYDLCPHGQVVFTVDGVSLSDDSEWCVSASAYRFLHALFADHRVGTEEFLLPCCGHSMYPSADGRSVTIVGCSNGLDFDILHRGETVLIQTADACYSVPYAEFLDAVLTFAGQIEEFYRTEPPRIVEDEFDRAGFCAFRTEWDALYRRAMEQTDRTVRDVSISFADYQTYPEESIVGVSLSGIVLNDFTLIDLAECADVFQQIEGGSGRCPGERDVACLSYTFYTPVHPTRIVFLPKNRLAECFAKENTLSRFHKLQKQLADYGYTTRDLSQQKEEATV